VPGVVGGAAADFDRLVILGDEDVFFEAIELAIVV